MQVETVQPAFGRGCRQKLGRGKGASKTLLCKYMGCQASFIQSRTWYSNSTYFTRYTRTHLKQQASQRLGYSKVHRETAAFQRTQIRYTDVGPRHR